MAKARKSRKTQPKANASPAIVTTPKTKTVTSTRSRGSDDVSSATKVKQSPQSATAATSMTMRSAMATRKRLSEVSDDDSSTSNARKAKRTRKLAPTPAPAAPTTTRNARATKGSSDGVSSNTKAKLTPKSAPAPASITTGENSTVTLRRSLRLSLKSSSKAVTETQKASKQKPKAITQTPKDATKTGTAKATRKTRSARVSSTKKNQAKPKQTTPKSTPKKKESSQAKRKAKSVSVSVLTPAPAPSSSSCSSSGGGGAGISARAQRVQRFNEARQIGLAKEEEVRRKKERAKMARERNSANYSASADHDHDRELVAAPVAVPEVPEGSLPLSGGETQSHFGSSSKASTSTVICSEPEPGFQLALAEWKRLPSPQSSEEEISVSELGYCNSNASSSEGDDCTDPLAPSPESAAAAAAAAGPMSPLEIQQREPPQSQALVLYSAVPPASDFEDFEPVPCSSQSLTSTVATGSGLPISDADIINFVLESESSEDESQSDDGSISDTEIFSVPVRAYPPHPARHAETQCNSVDVNEIQANNSSRVFGGRRGRSRSRPQSRQRLAGGNNAGSSLLLSSACPAANLSITQLSRRLPGAGVPCPRRIHDADADPRT